MNVHQVGSKPLRFGHSAFAQGNGVQYLHSTREISLLARSAAIKGQHRNFMTHSRERDREVLGHALGPTQSDIGNDSQYLHLSRPLKIRLTSWCFHHARTQSRMVPNPEKALSGACSLPSASVRARLT